jgi:hypothetical protein
MTLPELLRLIRQEVYAQIPPIPAGVAGLDDSDTPLVPPSNPTNQQVLNWNAATGQWVASNLSTIPSTDGNAPGSSPPPTLVGGIGWIYVLWTPISNHDPVTYEVHISTSNGFTASGATKAGELQGSIFTIKQLPDGTPLDYNTTYYVVIVSKDADGSASQSAQASGSPVQAQNADLAANSVTADKIVGNSITADKLASALILTNTLYVPNNTGQRVVIDPTGITLFSSAGDQLVLIPTDSTKSPTFSGNVITGGLVVTGGAVIQGSNNVMDKGSALTLNEKLADPGTLSVAFEYPTLALSGFRNANRGLDYDSVGGTGGATAVYLTADYNVVTAIGQPTSYVVVVREYDTSGNLLRNSANGNVNAGATSIPDYFGAVRLGSFVWVLWRQPSGTVKITALNQNDFSTANTVTITPSGNTSVIMAFGTDGTNLLVGTWSSSSSSAVPHVTRYSVSGSTPSFLDQFDLTGGSTRQTNNGFGGLTRRESGHYVTTIQRNDITGHPTYVERWDNTTKARTDFWNPDCLSLAGTTGKPWQGTTYNGTSYLSIDGDQGVIFTYSGWTWTAGSQNDTYQIGFAWYDGTHESAISPAYALVLNGANSTLGQATSTEVAMRGRIRVVTASLPSGVTSERIYMKLSSTAVAAASQSRQTTASTSSGGGSYTSVINSYNAAGGAALSVSTFPGATSNIKGIGSAITATWNLGGDGTVLLPRMTVTQRPTPTKGQIAWNEDRGQIEAYTGSVWQTAGLEVVGVSVTIGSTAAQSGTSQSVTITPLNSGDIVFYLGSTVGSPILMYVLNPIVTVANTTTLRYFNADSVSHTFNGTVYFGIVRQS